MTPPDFEAEARRIRDNHTVMVVRDIHGNPTGSGPVPHWAVEIARRMFVAGLWAGTDVCTELATTYDVKHRLMCMIDELGGGES